MQGEQLALLGFWTATGFAGLVLAGLGRRQAVLDRAVLHGDGDPIRRYLAASAVRMWTGRMLTQVLVLTVAALATLATVPAFAADTLRGFVVRWTLILALELVSAQLALESAIDLYADWKVRQLAKREGGKDG